VRKLEIFSLRDFQLEKEKRIFSTDDKKAEEIDLMGLEQRP